MRARTDQRYLAATNRAISSPSRSPSSSCRKWPASGIVTEWAPGIFRSRTRSQPDEASPVVPDDGPPAQVEGVEEKFPHPAHMTGVRMVRDVGRLVRTAEPNEIRSDRPQSGRGQDGDDGPVQVRPRRFTVQQD